ncbi:MAG: K(+)-transporting ATPase subunit F [Anaerovoracaceae bacterium]
MTNENTEEGKIMSVGMISLAAILVGLGMYLLYALVNPEKF